MEIKVTSCANYKFARSIRCKHPKILGTEYEDMMDVGQHMMDYTIPKECPLLKEPVIIMYKPYEEESLEYDDFTNEELKELYSKEDLKELVELGEIPKEKIEEIYRTEDIE